MEYEFGDNWFRNGKFSNGRIECCEGEWSLYVTDRFGELF